MTTYLERKKKLDAWLKKTGDSIKQKGKSVKEKASSAASYLGNGIKYRAKQAGFHLKYFFKTAQSGDGNSAWSLLLLVGIIYLGIASGGTFGIDFSNLTFSGLSMLIIIFIVLLFFKLIHFINGKQMMMLALAMVIIGLATKAYVNLSIFSKLGFQGGEQVIAFFVALIIILLFLLHELYPLYVTSGRMGIALLVLFLILFGVQLVTYLFSQDFQGDFQNQRAEFEAQGYDLIDIFRAYFLKQQVKGNGTLLTAGFEDTYEFIGLEIQSVTPQKSQYYSDENVILDIDYHSNIYFPVSLYTSCKTDAVGTGIVDEPLIEITAATNPTVRCEMGQLPRGTHVIDVIAAHNYESTVHIPLKIMDESFANTITKRVEDPAKFLEQYVGGSTPAITTSGPVKIGVATSGTELQTPILYDKNNQRLMRIRIQFQEDELHGEVYYIEGAYFDVPAGIEITNCSFGTPQPDTSSILSKRSIYRVDGAQLAVGDYQTFTCDVELNPSYVDEFLPPIAKWSPQSILFTVEYYYKVQEKTTVRVIS